MPFLDLDWDCLWMITGSTLSTTKRPHCKIPGTYYSGVASCVWVQLWGLKTGSTDALVWFSIPSLSMVKHLKMLSFSLVFFVTVLHLPYWVRLKHSMLQPSVVSGTRAKLEWNIQRPSLLFKNPLFALTKMHWPEHPESDHHKEVAQPSATLSTCMTCCCMPGMRKTLTHWSTPPDATAMTLVIWTK